MQKQIIIPTSSSSIIYSLSHIRAMIDIQKGLVYQHTVTKDTGSIVVPKVIKKKFRCPVRLLQSIEYGFYFGNIFSGLMPAQRHQIIDIGMKAKTRSKTNSIGLKPFLATVLKVDKAPTLHIVATFIASIAKHLLSFDSLLLFYLSSSPPLSSV